jgi:23S rRNA maturation mini-RNase III
MDKETELDIQEFAKQNLGYESLNQNSKILIAFNMSKLNDSPVSDYQNSSLATLGDSVAQLFLCLKLFEEGKTIGCISQQKQRFLTNQAFAFLAKELGLLVLRYGGTQQTSTKLDETLFEAVLGAMYLDLGCKITKEFWQKICYPKLLEFDNSKSQCTFKNYSGFEPLSSQLVGEHYFCRFRKLNRKLENDCDGILYFDNSKETLQEFGQPVLFFYRDSSSESIEEYKNRTKNEPKIVLIYKLNFEELKAYDDCTKSELEIEMVKIKNTNCSFCLRVKDQIDCKSQVLLPIKPIMVVNCDDFKISI